MLISNFLLRRIYAHTYAHTHTSKHQQQKLRLIQEFHMNSIFNSRWMPTRMDKIKKENNEYKTIFGDNIRC